MRLIISIIIYIKNIPSIIINSINFFLKNVENRTSLNNIKGVLFIKNQGEFIINKGVKINSKYSKNPIGGQCFSSFYIMKGGHLEISENAGISNSAIVCANKIYIGEGVNIGGDCKIYDTDFHPLEYKDRISNTHNKIKTAPISIEEGVFIGGGVLILKGVSIGERSIIGAGSVVTKNIPANEIWAGNPAKFIRKLI
jgi:acetyltransferase-like isoleucine patch superfamily enzyme